MKSVKIKNHRFTPLDICMLSGKHLSVFSVANF